MKWSIILFCALLQYSVSVPIENDSKRSIKREISELISTKSTQVAALGRVADLGDLYDARTDNFVEISLYTTDLSGDAVHVTDSAYSTIDYVRTESLSEKMDKLGVSASLSVSFLGGLVSASGSGKYLNEDKKSAKSAKTSLVYSVRTVSDNLKIFSKTSRDLIDKFLLESIDATHVVVGVEWGADVVLSIEETNTDSSNVQEIQGKLEATLNLAVLSVSGSAEVDFGSSDVEKSSSFSLHINGDIIPNTVPQTINESISFIRSIPQLIEKENDGKGKIMSYILMPLVTVQKVFQSESNKSGVVKDIDQELIDQFMRIFQEMKDSELQINDVYNDMSKWTLMIPESDYGNVSDIKSRFDSFANDLRVKFSNLVVQFRNGELDDEALKDLITSYEESDWTPAKIEKMLELYTPTMHKIRLMNLFQSFNALFVDRRTDKYKILTDNYQQEVRILSVDLGIDVSSEYVLEIIRILEANAGNESSEAIPHYIEDDPNLIVPKVNAYLDGNVINSFPVGKTEYIILIPQNVGPVIIIDGNTNDQIMTYDEPTLYLKSVAVVNETFYSIDTKIGAITSTNVENIITPPQDGITWNLVSSFPNDSYTESVAAVNGSIFYFVSNYGILYKYDTELKTVIKCAKLETSDVVPWLTIVNGIVYIYQDQTFYSFDGTVLTKLATPEKRTYARLFEFNGDVCVVGGDLEYATNDQHPVYCYDPDEEKWTVSSYINEARDWPGIVTTKSGTIIFGGWGKNSEGSGSKVYSAEIFNHDTKTWSYISYPPAMANDDYYSAISINF